MLGLQFSFILQASIGNHNCPRINTACYVLAQTHKNELYTDVMATRRTATKVENKWTE